MHLVQRLPVQYDARRSTLGGDPADSGPRPPPGSTLTSCFRSLALCLACASLGCGGDDTMEPPPQCTVDVALTGGYEVSATGTSCNGGSQQGPDAFTVIIDVPDGKSNSVQLRLFGVQLGGGAKGMTVPAGVLFGTPNGRVGARCA